MKTGKRDSWGTLIEGTYGFDQIGEEDRNDPNPEKSEFFKPKPPDKELEDDEIFLI